MSIPKQLVLLTNLKREHKSVNRKLSVAATEGETNVTRCENKQIKNPKL